MVLSSLLSFLALCTTGLAVSKMLAPLSLVSNQSWGSGSNILVISLLSCGNMQMPL
jgi:hypothetical protein